MKKLIIAIILLFTISTTLTSCRDDKANDSVEETIENIEDRAEEAAESIEDTAEDAIDNIENSTDNAS